MAFLSASLSRHGSGHLKRLSLLWFVASALLYLSTPDVQAQTQPFKEYQIKAAFLFNFTQFVEWPTNAVSDTNATLTIGILGTDPFGKILDDIVRDEKVNGHPLAVKRFRRIEEVKDCHILFISQSEAKRLPEILPVLQARSILTVGETEGFARGGGMIRFITEKSKIRLRINMEAAKAAKLTISSKLLTLAEIVATEKN